MDLELLVSRLTRAILTELQEEQRQTILLFTGRDRHVPAGLCDLFGSAVRLRHVAEPYRMEEVDRFILPILHIDQMVDLALGKGGSRLMYAVRQVLLAGRQVEVFEWEYRKYLATAPRSLISLYEQYRSRLAGFGLIDCPGEKKQSLRFDKKVVTEADVRSAQEQGFRKLDIALGCRVTPLALETARDLGICISTDTGGIA